MVKRNGCLENSKVLVVTMLVDYKNFGANDKWLGMEPKSEEDKCTMDSTMNTRDMILTTEPTVDGYRIVKQCGVVYGETVFRHGVLVSLGAKIMNTIDSF